MTKSYTANYNNGFVVNLEAVSLQQALKQVEDNLNYTGHSVIVLEKEKVVAQTIFYGVRATEEDCVIACFGKFGFYADWWLY